MLSPASLPGRKEGDAEGGAKIPLNFFQQIFIIVKKWTNSKSLNLSFC